MHVHIDSPEVGVGSAHVVPQPSGCTSKKLALCQVHKTTQDVALHHVSRDTMQCNAGIDSDPILAFLCVAFMHLITKFWPEMHIIANSIRHNARVLCRVVNQPLD